MTGLQTCVKKIKCAKNMVMELKEGKCISMLIEEDPWTDEEEEEDEDEDADADADFDL